MDDFFEFELFMITGELDGFADISDSRLDTRLVVFKMTVMIGCERAYNMDKQNLDPNKILFETWSRLSYGCALYGHQRWRGQDNCNPVSLLIFFTTLYHFIYFRHSICHHNLQCILYKETLQQNVCHSSILCQHWCYEVLSNITLALFQMTHFLFSHNNHYDLLTDLCSVRQLAAFESRLIHQPETSWRLYIKRLGCP